MIILIFSSEISILGGTHMQDKYLESMLELLQLSECNNKIVNLSQKDAENNIVKAKKAITE